MRHKLGYFALLFVLAWATVADAQPITYMDPATGPIVVTSEMPLPVTSSGSTVTLDGQTPGGTAATLTDVLLRLGCVRDDATSTLHADHADGDWTPFRCNARGELHVNLATALSAGSDSVRLGDGTFTQYIDPCQRGARTFVIINQTAGTQLAAGVAATRIYICHIQLISDTAQDVGLVSGTGSVCATSLGGVMGGPSAATGWQFTAGSGIVVGNGGYAVGKSDTDEENLCLLQSSSGQVSGNLSYVTAAN